jgi:hypothetical protein
MAFKTLEELKQFFLDLEETESMQVGPRCSNHHRSVHQIGMVQIITDTVMPYNWLEKSSEWFWTCYSMTSEQAIADAAVYDAEVYEAPYSDDDDARILHFNTVDGCLQWILDYKADQLVLS